jgi:hypothetical protein
LELAQWCKKTSARCQVMTLNRLELDALQNRLTLARKKIFTEKEVILMLMLGSLSRSTQHRK